jgi:excisionase family DNA binding protein
MQFQNPDNAQIRTHSGNLGSATGDERLPKPPIVVCVLVVPEGTELTLNALRDALSRDLFREGASTPAGVQNSRQSIDTWLTHSAAAEYLGISQSTLYRYAEHRTIESRKLCGRLQYRLASLDRFKDQHIRRALRSPTDRAILSTAPTSGK